MNEVFTKFLKNRITNKELLNKYLSKENISIEEIYELSMLLNTTCYKLIGLYLNLDFNYPNRIYVEELIENKDVLSLKRLVIEKAIRLNDGKIIISNIYSNKAPSFELSKDQYNTIVRLLIENGDIDCALMISDQQCYYEGDYLKTANIVDYLVDSTSDYFNMFIVNVFPKLPLQLKNKVEPILVEKYIKNLKLLIEKLNQGYKKNSIEISTNPVIYCEESYLGSVVYNGIFEYFNDQNKDKVVDLIIEANNKFELLNKK